MSASLPLLVPLGVGETILHTLLFVLNCKIRILSLWWLLIHTGNMFYYCLTMIYWQFLIEATFSSSFFFVLPVYPSSANSITPTRLFLFSGFSRSLLLMAVSVFHLFHTCICPWYPNLFFLAHRSLTNLAFSHIFHRSSSSIFSFFLILSFSSHHLFVPHYFTIFIPSLHFSLFKSISPPAATMKKKKKKRAWAEAPITGDNVRSTSLPWFTFDKLRRTLVHRPQTHSPPKRGTWGVQSTAWDILATLPPLECVCVCVGGGVVIKQ